MGCPSFALYLNNEVIWWKLPISLFKSSPQTSMRKASIKNKDM